jgi:Flp pilus assembly protein TadG
MVEFALVMPVFFAAIWGIINGGLLLYSMNAVAHSAQIGSMSIAASGDVPNTDILGVQRMAQAGLGTTALVTVTEIDVEELENSPTGGYQTSNGSPVIQTGCAGARGTFAGTGDCVDRYSFTDNAGSVTVNVLDPGCTASVDVSQCPPWTPESRSVSNDLTGQSPTGSGCSYVELVVSYHFNFFGAPAGDIQLTSRSDFRLEPQT